MTKQLQLSDDEFMHLSKKLTTVTPFSRYFALSLFVILPILAYFFGAYNQYALDQNMYAAKVYDQTTQTIVKKVTDNKITTSNTSNMQHINKSNMLSPTTQQIPTNLYAGWQTYRLTTPTSRLNSEGATIKYPANWQLSIEYGPGDLGTKADTFATITSPISESAVTTDDNTITGKMTIQIIYGDAPFVPDGLDYVIKSTPIIIPNFKRMNIIEDGCPTSNCISELALSDASVRIGGNYSADAPEYNSKSNKGMKVKISAGLFYSTTQNGGYASMSPTTFESLQDYNTALNILKSLSY